MILVNTTFVVSDESAADVLSWIEDAYAASARKMGAQTQIFRVLSHAESGTAVYAAHASFETMAQAERWDRGVGDKLRQMMSERWGERALTFQTYLESVR